MPVSPRIPIPNRTIEVGAGVETGLIDPAWTTIDIWYPGAVEDRPLAVDPFTVDKRRGKTVRLPNLDKSDFYSYLKNIPKLTQKLEKAKDVAAIPNEVHYLMAVLIRGGVFSGESDKK